MLNLSTPNLDPSPELGILWESCELEKVRGVRFQVEGPQDLHFSFTNLKINLSYGFG